MGYGEVGGGGSVDWVIAHGGDLGFASGTDPHPPNANGKFVVRIETTPPIVHVVPLATKIRIRWVEVQAGASDNEVIELAYQADQQSQPQIENVLRGIRELPRPRGGASGL
jgi:hypothetical protein